MKKVLTFSVLGFVFLASSCNRNFTCTCTSVEDGSITEKSEYNLSKRDAESACENAGKKEGQTCILEEF